MTHVLFYLEALSGQKGDQGSSSDIGAEWAAISTLFARSDPLPPAHELGHLLGIRHPWGSDNDTDTAASKIPDDHLGRLMGYGGGNRIIKREAEIIHQNNP